MISSLYYIAIASALLALLEQDAFCSKVVIDEEPLEDGSIVSSQLCDLSGAQDARITRISTISKLHDYFGTLADVNQALCREFYLEPLAGLRAIVEVGNENVCGAEMMEKLNQFHWHYVVGILSKKWRKASNGTLPYPLRIFFMNYAQHVTERCKDTLLQRLTTATSGSTDISTETLEIDKFGPVISQLSDIIHTKEKVKKHDDFLLLWDQFIDKERRRGRLINHKVDSTTGELIHMSFKVKDPEKVWAVQRKCRQDMRPIYRQTVLPVMKFISIGYGSVEKHLRDDVAGSEMVKSWYAITQFCELILPVNFYRGKSLQKEQTLIMSMDESKGLGVPEESLAGESSGANFAIQPTRLDADILPDATSDQIAKFVKFNLKARGRIYRRVIRKTFGKLKSKLKNLFISKKVGDNKYVAEDGESVINGRDNKLLHAADDDDVDDDGDGDDTSLMTGDKLPGSLIRHKRQTWGALLFDIFAICLIMTVVIGGIVALIVFILSVTMG